MFGATTDGSRSPAPEVAANPEQPREKAAASAAATEVATVERGAAMGQVPAARAAATEVGIRVCIRVNCPRFFGFFRELASGERGNVTRTAVGNRRTRAGWSAL